MTNHVKFSNPAGMAAPVGYSHMVEVTGGKLVFIAGQVALDAEGNLVGAGDMRAQMVQVFENLKTALTAAGGDFSHVIKFGFFTVDFDALLANRDVRDQYVNTGSPPASTAVEVRRLFREDFLVEIEVVAVIPG